MYRSVAENATRGGMASDNGDAVVTLHQLPRWNDADQRSYVSGDISSPLSYFSDPLTAPSEADSGVKSRFPVDHEINSKIYLWRGNPWNLEVDAVVNSTNEVRFGVSCYSLLSWNVLLHFDASSSSLCICIHFFLGGFRFHII